jgi:4-hydroxy-3-polyprenylbenzoate decarboxylase
MSGAASSPTSHAHGRDAQPLVLGITGASGAIYAVRLLEQLVAAGRDVHVILSPSGQAVLLQELGVRCDWQQLNPQTLLDAAKTSPLLQRRGESPADALPADRSSGRAGRVLAHRYDDFLAPVASGSFLTGGMVICPCSGSTLSGIAHATGDNLVHRAADVHLKERRRLILVPRETPLSVIQLDNMRRAAEAGAVVLPAMPGWYHGVQSLADLVDFVVARILDQLEVPHHLMRRWGES